MTSNEGDEPQRSEAIEESGDPATYETEDERAQYAPRESTRIVAESPEEAVVRTYNFEKRIKVRLRYVWDGHDFITCEFQDPIVYNYLFALVTVTGQPAPSTWNPNIPFEGFGFSIYHYDIFPSSQHNCKGSFPKEKEDELYFKIKNEAVLSLRVEVYDGSLAPLGFKDPRRQYAILTVWTDDTIVIDHLPLTMTDPNVGLLITTYHFKKVV